MKFQNVKGTRDFYPEDMARRNWLIGKWREIARRNGFVEYDGPVFEYLELYTNKSGEGIVSELYNFEDRGGRELALRPEMTPTLARMVAARANALPKPIKWFCVPNFFRAERPQRGRLREFWQWNVDIIGAPDEANNVADAECVMVALDFLREAGFGPEQLEMRISSRTLIAQILEILGIEAARHAAVYAVLDKRDKMAPEVFIEQVSTLSLEKEQQSALLKLGEARGPEGLAMIEHLLGGSQAPESPLGRLKGVLGLLKVMKLADYCIFDPGIIRGLAYYTGIVFEAYSKGTLGRAICGGGRYDNLLKEVGGPPLSGVGFGMGDVIVLDQLEEMGLLKLDQDPKGFYVVNEGMERIDEAMAIVSIVRSYLKHPCNYSYRRTSVKKQMQEASAHNVSHVLIVGERIALKNMATGDQVELSFNGKLEDEADCEVFRAELRTLLSGPPENT